MKLGVVDLRYMNPELWERLLAWSAIGASSEG
jgi:hypothetical protein